MSSLTFQISSNVKIFKNVLIALKSNACNIFCADLTFSFLLPSPHLCYVYDILLLKSFQPLPFGSRYDGLFSK